MQMELNIGMNRAGLRKLGQELVDACDKGGSVDVTRYIPHNRSGGEELMLSLNNDDMENEQITDETYFYELDD